jgi:hypothetical protein
MPAKETSRELSAKQVLKCIRSGMSNADLMKTFKISPAGMADLLKQLFEAKLISEDDLRRRGVEFKIKKKEGSESFKPIMSAPPPSDGDTEFVDTVTLTEMLTFTPPSPKNNQTVEELDQILEQDLEDDTKEKKGKFTLGSIFKKS